jgi:hypothetical protein
MGEGAGLVLVLSFGVLCVAVALLTVISIGNDWRKLRDLRGLTRAQGRVLMNEFYQRRSAAKLAARAGMLGTAIGFAVLFVFPGSITGTGGIREAADPIGALALLVGGIALVAWSFQAATYVRGELGK